MLCLPATYFMGRNQILPSIPERRERQDGRGNNANALKGTEVHQHQHGGLLYKLESERSALTRLLLGASGSDLGHQLRDLFIEALLGFLLKLLEFALIVLLLPFFFFCAQRSRDSIWPSIVSSKEGATRGDPSVCSFNLSKTGKS
jgi:hypothetical protein